MVAFSPTSTKVKVDRTHEIRGITRIVSEGDHVDIEAADIHVHLNKYKVRLGVCLVPGTDDEFIRVDNPDLHVL